MNVIDYIIISYIYAQELLLLFKNFKYGLQITDILF